MATTVYEREIGGAVRVRKDYKLVRSNSRSIYGKIVQLQFALNDDDNDVLRKIKHVTHFRANN